LLFCFLNVAISFAQINADTKDWDDSEGEKVEKILDPNPSYGKLQIDLSKYNHAFYELSIRNIIGKKLWSKRIYEAVQLLDLTELRKGSYLFAISSPNGDYLDVLRLVIIDP